ncbi:hypothetical protein FGO68_gene4357 [Halteria grandinella]|uniref:Uncharacterized protein n=1 Tax=Halteria grandinella TaxID=5974 RepID=A0A8J8NKI5_HALGN|nr:hypothetical protein FGO68_gene4357 [Halteria grandinella]
MEKKISPAKVVVLGEARVGKTSLTQRFVNGQFNERQPSTVDATYQEKSLNIGSQSIKLVIWDTAGQERYHALNQVYYRGAEGAVVVYDCTDADTFKKMNQWVSELRQYLPQEVPIMIAGNKADLGASSSTKKIDDEQAQTYARSVNSQYFPTSAKTGNNVDEIFHALAKRIIDNQLHGTSQISLPTKLSSARGALKVEGLDFNPSVKLEDVKRQQRTGKKGGCCK